MTDQAKDQVLPRLSSQQIDLIVDPKRCYRVQLGRLGMEELERLAEAQRDAAWKVLQPLVEAAKVFSLHIYTERFCPSHRECSAYKAFDKALAQRGVKEEP